MPCLEESTEMCLLDEIKMLAYLILRQVPAQLMTNDQEHVSDTVCFFSCVFRNSDEFKVNFTVPSEMFDTVSAMIITVRFLFSQKKNLPSERHNKSQCIMRQMDLHAGRSTHIPRRIQGL